MRFLPEFRSHSSISTVKYLVFGLLKSQSFHVSISWKSPTAHSSEAIPVSEASRLKKREIESGAEDTAALFHKITKIVGTEHIKLERNSHEISILEETHIRGTNARPQPVCGNAEGIICFENQLKEKQSCRSDGIISDASTPGRPRFRNRKKRRQLSSTSNARRTDKRSTRTEFRRKNLFNKGVAETSMSENTHIRNAKIGQQNFSNPLVCGNAEERIQFRNNAGEKKCQSEEIICETSLMNKTQLGNSSVEDVSPMVNRIAQIVRGEDAKIPMEENLEKLGLHFNPAIVEKVLKRCFKVGHLALRFFNWVKLQPGFRHSTETYNVMIYIAGEGREFNLVEKLLDDMCTESCPKNVNTWTTVISHYGKAKVIGKALLAFDRMTKSGCQPDDKAYKSIICALCNVGKTDLSMEFYKEMVSKKKIIDKKLCRMLMHSLSAAGHTEAVRTVGDDMVKIAEIPECEVFASMLRSFCISGRIGEALQLMQEINDKTPMPNPESFEVLAKGLCRVGRVTDALEVINIMKQSRAIDGKAYGVIINGYLRVGDVCKATEVLSSMKECGCLPMVSTYTNVIQHLFHSNEYEKACGVYQEMLEGGIEPDIVVITAMVAGHVCHGHIFEAWEAFNGMKKKGIEPTRKSYSVFIMELCKASKLEEAFKLLNEMCEMKINPGDKLFHLVSSSLQKKGELEKASKVWQMSRIFKLYNTDDQLENLATNRQEVADRSHNVDSTVHEKLDYLGNHNLCFNQIEPLGTGVLSMEPFMSYRNCDLDEVCRILSSCNDWQAMQEDLEKIQIHFTPELIVEILRHCQRHGFAALRFFSWVGQEAGYKHTTETYNMAIKISGSAKDFRHMRKLHVEMRRKHCLATSDTWTIMITQYGRAGLTEIALKKFQEMKSEGFMPNGSTYKYLILFLCGKKGQKVNEAIKMFQEMINARHVPDKELAEIYLTCLCETRRLSDARRSFETLHKSGFSIQTSYSLFIRALCRAGRLEEALALEGEMAELGLTADQYIYGSLVHGLLRGGQFNEALQKIDAMKQSGIVPTVHVYTSLIVHFFKEKQIGKALEMFNRMLVEGCDPTVVTYSALIRGYVTQGMIFEAWNVFRRMKLKGPVPDFRTYSMFVSCLCRAGKSEEALQLIYEMLKIGVLPTNINFKTVFYGLNREGKQDLAHTVLKTKWALARQRKFSR